MKLHDIAFRNIRRKKSRIVFLFTGLFIGIATFVTIYHMAGAMKEDLATKMDEFDANIMVLPRSNTISLSYGGITIPGAQYDVREIHEEELSSIWKIKNNENLAIVSPKLLGAAGIGTDNVLIVGVDLDTEIRLKKWWSFTEESSINLARTDLPSPIDPERMVTQTVIEGLEKDHVIVGSEAARLFGILPGSILRLRHGDTEEVFSVLGVLKPTGSQDDSIVFMNLASAQSLLGRDGRITLVEVAALCAGCPVEEMAAQINSVLPNGRAMPIKQVVAQRMQSIEQFGGFGLIISVVILLIGSFIVFTTMMSSVMERKREIGIFRAIGFRKSHVAAIILMEAAVLCLVAGITGYLAGLGITTGVLDSMASIDAHPPLDIRFALSVAAIALAISMAASAYPALRAAKIDPAEALRQI